MSRLDEQLVEDRAMRDAAKMVLMADIEHTKEALSGKAIAGRVGNKVGDGAKDVFEIARFHAEENRGILAAIIAAVILWFAKDPILNAMGFGSASDNETDDIAAQETEAGLHEDASPPLPADQMNNHEAKPDEQASNMVSDND